MLELITICIFFLLPNGDVECRCHDETTTIQKNAPVVVETYETTKNTNVSPYRSKFPID